ncbi:hypothetical protein PSEUDT2_04146 [Stutzerimonas stutzeri]|uniref:hypothetical protein n=1 Tax=Stutzerimonas stutzeri TaxID=316 RepID=UPI0016455778|nr:hypothetical protein [Stutzerimonas stutzeri]CAD2261445.1 hypothetical protein PSEUDT2_04146 [Stutzerimonas stutzeri]
MADSTPIKPTPDDLPDRTIYECTGCGTVTRDRAAQMALYKRAGALSCCPERNMVLVQQAEQPVQYTIGDMTYEKVFKAAGLTNLSDMQAVLDAVEAAIANTAPQPEQRWLTGQCVIEVVSGREGPSLYIGDGGISHRLSGNKPWAGGNTLHLFTVDIAELVREATALSALGGHHDH